MFYAELSYVLGLVIMAFAEKTKIYINKIKTAYDLISCILGVVLSFSFFGSGHFEGVKLGTVICAFFNGFLIGQFTKLREKHFEFTDRFKLRKYFDKQNRDCFIQTVSAFLICVFYNLQKF